MLSYDEIVERLPAYALGALDPDEMAEVEAYLDSHDALRDQLADLDATMLTLEHALASPAPPPEIREALMARVHADLGPRAPVTTDPPGESWLDRLRGWLTPPSSRLAAAALAVALLLVSFGAVSLQGSLTDARQRVIALEEENSRLIEAQLTENQRAILTGSGQRVSLPGTEAAPSARGAAFIDGTDGLLLLEGLPEIAEDQQFQLWLIPADGDPVPAGLIAAADRGIAPLSLPVTVDEFALIGLSIEPSGGSESPTGPIVLLGEIG